MNICYIKDFLKDQEEKEQEKGVRPSKSTERLGGHARIVVRTGNIRRTRRGGRMQ